MEKSPGAQERRNPFLQAPQNCSRSSNGFQVQSFVSESKPIYRSEPANICPTTFIEADTSSFKQVVQMLTGSSETAKQASKSTITNDPLQKSIIPPIKSGPKKQGFKLYERRNSLKNIKLSPLVPGSNHNFGFPPRNSSSSEILSPSVLDFPSLRLSPVTPLITDPFNRRSPASVTSNSSVEEDRAIAEKGFYLHPSPISIPRDSEPQLLPLFPLTSPRVSGSSSSSSS